MNGINRSGNRRDASNSACRRTRRGGSGPLARVASRRGRRGRGSGLAGCWARWKAAVSWADSTGHSRRRARDGPAEPVGAGAAAQALIIMRSGSAARRERGSAWATDAPAHRPVPAATDDAGQPVGPPGRPCRQVRLLVRPLGALLVGPRAGGRLLARAGCVAKLAAASAELDAASAKACGRIGRAHGCMTRGLPRAIPTSAWCCRRRRRRRRWSPSSSSDMSPIARWSTSWPTRPRGRSRPPRHRQSTR